MSTVLVVDDMQTDRELLGKVISASGHHVEYAADGADALTKAKNIRPAVIFLDVVMPRQDGYATCRQLKKDPDTSTIPVVFVTSKNAPADRFWGESQGASAYIGKPFSADEVMAVMRRLA